MPNIETLDILTINCNTMDTQEVYRANKCSINTGNCQGSRYEQHYTNMMQEAERPQKCYTNTDNISNSDTKDGQMVIDDKNNKINYFLLLQVTPDRKSYQTPLRYVANALQKPFKEGLEHLQQQDIIILLGMDETVESYKKLCISTKPNGKV